RDRESGEASDERVVLAAPRGVDRDDGIPADERGGEARTAGGGCTRRGRGEHAQRGERLEGPGGRVRGRARRSGDRPGEARDRRAVHGGRVAPGRPEVREGGALRERRGRVDVRVPASLGGDPAV